MVCYETSARSIPSAEDSCLVCHMKWLIRISLTEYIKLAGKHISALTSDDYDSDTHSKIN